MQTETTQRKLTWWGINVLVLLYAFIPVVWILSLSLKDDATLNDGRSFLLPLDHGIVKLARFS